MAGNASKLNGKKGGRPKGTKSAVTLEKEAVLKVFRERVMRSADILFNSQMSLARGQQFLYKIEKEFIKTPKGGYYRNKKPRIVTNQEEIELYLEGAIKNGDMDCDYDPASTYYFLTTKEPNNQAAESLLDRALGKSVQITELTGKDGKDLIPSSESKAETDKAIESYLKIPKKK
jgi:hypothetical protein